MDKKKAIATAGAVTVTALAGALAIAANLGLLSANADEGIGDVTPVSDVSGSPDAEVVTVFVDDPASAGGVQPVQIVVTDEPTPRPTATASTFDDHGGDRDDDDRLDDSDDDDDDDDDRRRRRRGSDDDD